MHRSPILLAGLLVALVLLIFILSQSNGGPEMEGAASSLLYPALDTEDVDRITIRGGGNVAELFREGEKWMVATEENYDADRDGMDRILEALASLSAEEVVSRKSEKYSVFELDSAQAVEVEIDSGGETAARFFIGKSGADFQSTYIRDSEREDVFLQHVPLKSVFDRGSRTWKDKTVFRLDDAEMLALELDRRGEKIRFENRGEGTWVVTEPPGHRPAGALVAALARGLTRLTCTDFAADGEREAAALDEPVAAVRIFMRDEQDRVLLIGAEKEEGGGRYVQRGSDDVLFVVPGSRLVHYLKPAAELIEPVPPDSSLMAPAGPEEEPAHE